jgi:hypothetical protein
MTGQWGSERERIAKTADLGFVDRTLHLVAWEHGREVEEGARDSGYRDASDDRDLVLREAPPVRLYPSAGSDPPLGRDFDQRACRWPQAPQSSRGPVAQCGAAAGSEDSRHPPCIGDQGAVADGVDPTVDRVQSPLLQSVLDRPRADAEVE